MTGGVAPNGRARPADGTRRARSVRLQLAAGLVVPIGVYVILRRVFHSDLVALAITEALPVAWLLASGLRRRRVDPVVLVTALVLTAAFLVSLAAGGSTLPLKLRRAVVTGSLGLVCLTSVLVRRPILPLAMSWLGRWWPRFAPLAQRLGGPAARGRATVLTTIIGISLIADAVAQVTLAFSVSTAAFLGASRLARISALTLGVGVCLVYLRWSGPPSIEAEAALADVRSGREL